MGHIMACDATTAWLREHGLDLADVEVYELVENDRQVDVIRLDSRQLASIPPAHRPETFADTTGTSHLLFLHIPPEGDVTDAPGGPAS